PPRCSAWYPCSPSYGSSAPGCAARVVLPPLRSFVLVLYSIGLGFGVGLLVQLALLHGHLALLVVGDAVGVGVIGDLLGDLAAEHADVVGGQHGGLAAVGADVARQQALLPAGQRRVGVGHRGLGVGREAARRAEQVGHAVLGLPRQALHHRVLAERVVGVGALLAGDRLAVRPDLGLLAHLVLAQLHLPGDAGVRVGEHARRLEEVAHLAAVAVEGIDLAAHGAALGPQGIDILRGLGLAVGQGGQAGAPPLGALFDLPAVRLGVLLVGVLLLAVLEVLIAREGRTLAEGQGRQAGGPAVRIAHVDVALVSHQARVLVLVLAGGLDLDGGQRGLLAVLPQDLRQALGEAGVQVHVPHLRPGEPSVAGGLVVPLARVERLVGPHPHGVVDPAAVVVGVGPVVHEPVGQLAHLLLGLAPGTLLGTLTLVQSPAGDAPGAAVVHPGGALLEQVAGLAVLGVVVVDQQPGRAMRAPVRAAAGPLAGDVVLGD